VRSKATLFGHALHPMLIAFPIAFYTGALVGYIIYGVNEALFWFRFAVVLNSAGVIMAAVAAIPGFIDWLMAIPDRSPAKATGLKHMVLNVLALIVFAACAAVQLSRWNELLPSATSAIILTLVGFALTGAAGYFGWTLVQKHHVGVDLTPEQERLEPDRLERRPPVGSAGART
jgi:uncharacterized membrane protein